MDIDIGIQAINVYESALALPGFDAEAGHVSEFNAKYLGGRHAGRCRRCVLAGSERGGWLVGVWGLRA